MFDAYEYGRFFIIEFRRRNEGAIIMRIGIIGATGKIRFLYHCRKLLQKVI